MENILKSNQHADYQSLTRACQDAGLLDRDPIFYSVRMFVVGAMLVVGYAFLLTSPGWPLRLSALAALAIACVQGGFIAHEAGHRAITANRRLIQIIGYLFMTLPGGQAFSHWLYKHGRHHTHTNREDADLDMEVSIFALYARAAASKAGLFRWTTRHQGTLLWALVSLQAFSIRAETLCFLWTHSRRTRSDQVFIALHFAFWLFLPSMILGPFVALTNYCLVTWLMGPYLAGVFLPNHLGMRVIDRDESLEFAAHQLMTSRNLPNWLNLVSGGLSSQIEHHLFPYAPASRLAKLRPIVRAFAAKNGLPYTETTYLDALRHIRRHLLEMAEIAEKGDKGNG